MFSSPRKSYKMSLYYESNRLRIKINAPPLYAYVSCASFVQLIHMKMVQLAKATESSFSTPASALVNDYGLFERYNGIEKLIDKTANLFELSTLLNREENNIGIDYVIRRKSFVELHPTGSGLTTSQRVKIYNYFHKANKKLATKDQLVSLRKMNKCEARAEKSKVMGYFYVISVKMTTKKTTTISSDNAGDLNKSYFKFSCKEKIIKVKEKIVFF